MLFDCKLCHNAAQFEYEKIYLFDLMVILQNFPALDRKKVVECFLLYLHKEGLQVSRAEFEKNMHLKLKDRMFLEDIHALLQPNRNYDHDQAYDLIRNELIHLLPGESWQESKLKKVVS